MNVFQGVIDNIQPPSPSVHRIFMFFIPNKLGTTETLDADETKTPRDTNRVTLLADKPLLDAEIYQTIFSDLTDFWKLLIQNRNNV